MRPDPGQPSPRALHGVEQILARAGCELGCSGWLAVEQTMVDRFADLTGDRQWIHTDPGAAASSPLGGTIAHGFLTLALEPAVVDQVVRFEGFTRSLNYGVDRVRFPAPMPVGGRLRGRVALAVAEPRADGVQIGLDVTFERAGAERPVCVARTLRRLVL